MVHMRGNKHFGMMSASNVGSRRSAINGCDSQVRRWMLGCCPKGLWVFYSKSPLHLCIQSQSASVRGSSTFTDVGRVVNCQSAKMRVCRCCDLDQLAEFFLDFPLAPWPFQEVLTARTDVRQFSQLQSTQSVAKFLSRRWIQSMNKIRILPDTCKYYNTSTSLHCVERTS